MHLLLCSAAFTTTTNVVVDGNRVISGELSCVCVVPKRSRLSFVVTPFTILSICWPTVHLVVGNGGGLYIGCDAVVPQLTLASVVLSNVTASRNSAGEPKCWPALCLALMQTYLHVHPFPPPPLQRQQATVEGFS